MLLIIFRFSYCQDENIEDKVMNENFHTVLDENIQSSKIANIIKVLSSNEFGGRPANNPTVINKSVQFIENCFSEIGLDYPFDSETYRQKN